MTLHIHEAASAGQALTMLEESISRPSFNPSYDLVLCDVLIGDVMAYELLPKLRALLSEVVPVLMLSAHSQMSMVETCILAGADAYLLKPLEAYELRAVWHHCLRRDRSFFERRTGRPSATRPPPEAADGSARSSEAREASTSAAAQAP